MRAHAVINKVIKKAVGQVPTHLKGRFAEKFALAILMLKGYTPLSVNDRSGIAEVDLLLSKGDVIVLVEVKYRGTIEEGHYAIHPSQRARLEMQAALIQRQYPNKFVRIDGFFVYPHTPYVEHVENLWI